MIRKRWLAFLLCLACSDSESAWEGTIETLPNGAARVVNRGQGMWRDSDAWRLVPELAIGEVEGPEATTFAQIIALEVGDDGRIYVLDRQLNELRIFDAAGVHVRTAGRTGEGPGEYRGANGLLWLTPDSLIVIDQRGARYSVVNRDGEYVRSVPRSLPFYAWAFHGGLESGRVYEQTSVGTDELRRPVLIGAALSGESLPPDTISLPQPSAPSIAAFTVTQERGGVLLGNMFLGVPFAPMRRYRLDGDGNVWHGHSGEYRLFRSSLAGDTLTEIVLDAVPVPVTDAEIAEWDSGDSPKRFREMGGKLDLGRIPKTKPFFEDFVLDDAGFLWVGVNTPSGDAGFDVFDPEGRHLGRLEAPGAKRVVYIAPVVRNGRLHVVGYDELDVQRVLVFRVEGRQGVSPLERRM